MFASTASCESFENAKITRSTPCSMTHSRRRSGPPSSSGSRCASSSSSSVGRSSTKPDEVDPVLAMVQQLERELLPDVSRADDDGVLRRSPAVAAERTRDGAQGRDQDDGERARRRRAGRATGCTRFVATPKSAKTQTPIVTLRKTPTMSSTVEWSVAPRPGRRAPRDEGGGSRPGSRAGIRRDSLADRPCRPSPAAVRAARSRRRMTRSPHDVREQQRAAHERATAVAAAPGRSRVEALRYGRLMNGRQRQRPAPPPPCTVKLSLVRVPLLRRQAEPPPPSLLSLPTPPCAETAAPPLSSCQVTRSGAKPQDIRSKSDHPFEWTVRAV